MSTSILAKTFQVILTRSFPRTKNDRFHFHFHFHFRFRFQISRSFAFLLVPTVRH